MHYKEYQNIVKGKRSKAAGDNFEEEIEAACKYYHTYNIALIEKNQEPFHITKNLRNGKFEGYFESKSQPDYKGVIASNSKTVCFEAKHTDKDRILYSAVKEHQLESLENYQSYGAVCFILVSFLFDGVFKIPFGVWINMKKIFGRKYLKPDDIQQYKVPFKYGLYLFL